jgi:hypothetical protein
MSKYYPNRHPLRKKRRFISSIIYKIQNVCKASITFRQQHDGYRLSRPTIQMLELVSAQLQQQSRSLKPERKKPVVTWLWIIRFLCNCLYSSTIFYKVYRSLDRSQSWPPWSSDLNPVHSICTIRATCRCVQDVSVFQHMRRCVRKITYVMLVSACVLMAFTVNRILWNIREMTKQIYQ